MKVCVLSSGSKGNATYVETNSGKYLIDLGNSCLYVERKLNEIGVDVSSINAIFITHTHADHIDGLKNFLKKYNPTIYSTKGVYKELSSTLNIYDYFIITEKITIGSTVIDFIRTSHDAGDSLGYIFEESESSLVYITDTGYINAKYFSKLNNRSIYIMESNHDVELLMNGKYPYYLKQRIIGDKGHLSNKDSSYYLSKLIGNNTKRIILAHLSEENNNPDIAFNTLNDTLKNIDKNDIQIIIAKQNERTDLMEV